MRDLDQLREHDDDSNVRRLGLYTLAGVLSLMAFIAVSVSGIGPLGKSRAPAEERDPLAQLLAEQHDDPKAPPRAATEPVVPTSRRELARLSFPGILSGDEDTIEATVRAAQAEHAALTGRAPDLDLPTPVRAADIPASTLATEQTARLTRSARHDPLIAKAMPERSDGALAPEGSEGPYTLQVVSYESREPAERFVDALRRRGHRAYITQVEAPGRSRYFRVRVGPFATRQEAIAYQRRFDASERMHTLVVTNPAK